MRPFTHKYKQKIHNLEQQLQDKSFDKYRTQQIISNLQKENQKLKKDKEEAYYLLESIRIDFPDRLITKSQRWAYLTNLLHGPSKPQDRYDALKHYMDNLQIRLQSLENTLRYHNIIPEEDPEP